MVVLTGIFKAFDCINPKNLIAELFWHGFSPTALNWTQRMKINNSFSRWSVIEHGIPQGSVLGSSLFNIDLSWRSPWFDWLN